MKNIVRTVAAAAAVLLVAGTAGPASAAADDRGAHWLQGQLTNDLVHNDQYGFDDYGLTADFAFALKAIGGHATTVGDIRDALAGHVDSWTTGVDFGSSDIYAGSVAKAVVLAEATGADPASYGGVDLVSRLEDRVSHTAPTTGRIEDQSATDYANTIGQAFAARGLTIAGSPEAGHATKFLLKQQCRKGFFRLNFSKKSKADQTCDGAAKQNRTPDTDVTALAVLQLRALPHKSKAVKSSIKDAVGWLVRHQKSNGSFGGGTSTAASNSNSTGVAGWALGASGHCTAAVAAAKWVKKLQVSDDSGALAGEKGAIAYSSVEWKAAQQEGITTAARDSWRRATSQAAPALSYGSLKACR